MADKGKNVVENELPPSYDATVSWETLLAPRFRAEDFVKDGKKHMILAATGSAAMVRFAEIINSFRAKTDVTVRIVLTAAAVKYYLDHGYLLDELRELPHVDGVYTDTDQWSDCGKDGITLEHELVKWVDVLAVAPVDVGTFGKIANGIVDDLLTSLIRSFDHFGQLNPYGRVDRPKFLILAPAMNIPMLYHSAFRQQVKTLTEELSIKHVVTDYTSIKERRASTWSRFSRVIVSSNASSGFVSEDANGMLFCWQAVVIDIIGHVKRFDYLADRPDIVSKSVKKK